MSPSAQPRKLSDAELLTRAPPDAFPYPPDYNKLLRAAKPPLQQAVRLVAADLWHDNV